MNKDINVLQKANSTANVNSTEKQKKFDVLMAKTPENTDIIDDSTPMQRTTQIATTSVIVNKCTSVTLQIRPNKGSSNVNVVIAHSYIFSALKIKDPTLKLISPQNDIIDTLLQFPEVTNYTQIFTKIFKEPKDSRIYISNNIKSSRALGELNMEVNNTCQRFRYSSNQ